MRHKSNNGESRSEYVLTGLDWEGVPDDENPEWTEEDFKSARPLRETFPELAAYSAKRKAGRPKIDAPKKSKSFKLSQDLIEAIVASGKFYNARVEAVLREGLAQGKI